MKAPNTAKLMGRALEVFTYQELSDTLGIHQSQISQYKFGRVAMSYERACTLKSAIRHKLNAPAG